jgi:ribosomal protein L20A (L18A)
VAGRTAAENAFSTLAARLRVSRRETDIVRAAQNLHSLERTLKP